MSKVLVVGGAGYVGSHVAKALVKNGHAVKVFDNLSTGHRDLVKYGILEEGDLLQKAQINNSLATFLPDIVMHFAGKTLVGESVKNPGLYYENNVGGTLNLLEAIRATNPKITYIFSSTCSLYQVSDNPIDETCAIHPENPYAKTKRMDEEMIEDFSIAFGMKYCWLRYFNAAGCDPEGELGERHDPETHLIPRLLLHVLEPQKYPAQIFGNDYPTPDGTCIRDYVHVNDLARAHILSMDYVAKNGNDVFNLGSGNGYSVLQVVNMIEKVTGKKLDLPIIERRAGDPSRLVAASGKAKVKLGWSTSFDLEAIVRTTWNWIEKGRR